MKLIYRWLINSIIFPWTYSKMSRRINKMKDIDKAVELAMFLEENYWFNQYWFGRSIKNMWIKKVAKIDINDIQIKDNGIVYPQLHTKDFPMN